MTAIAPPAVSPFYITGGTLPADALSYVERQADRDLLEALRQGEYCYVLNSRQMGKSSLCVRAISRLRDEGVRTAFLDLTKFGGRNLTAEQWYAALLAALGRELGLRAECLAYWKEHPELPAVQRLFGAITEVALEREEGEGRKAETDGASFRPPPSGFRPSLVIFVDEIDVTRSLPFSTDEFFAAVRQCYVGRATEPLLKGVTFCLLGTATPAELIEDTRVSPFNIGRRIEVRDFTPEEAAPLALGLAGETGEPRLGREADSGGGRAPGRERGSEGASKVLLERILYWTGGHPYLTQRLCRAVAEARSVAPSLGRSLAPSDVDRACEALYLTHTAKEGDDNLALVRNRLLKSEVELAALLELYAKVRAGKGVADDETNALCGVLKLSGVAKVEAGRLRVRNRIYGEVFDRGWVATHMPDAELRRQREAYRRGLVRAASVAAVVVAVVVGLALTALRQTGIAQEALRGREQANTGLRVSLRKEQAERARADSEARQKGELAAQRAKALQDALAQKQRADGQTLIATQNAQLATNRAEALREALGARDKALGDARQQAELARENERRAHAAGRLAVRRAEEANRNLYAANMNVIQSDWESGNVSRIFRLLAETRSHSGRGFEWGYWNRLCHLDLLTLTGHTGPVSSVSFSPDGRRIVTGSGNFVTRSGDNTAKVWDAQSGREMVTLKGHTGPVYSVSFSPDGRRILTGSSDGTARVWDAASGRETLRIPGDTGAVLSVSFSPDGQRILTGGRDVTPKVWDVASGQEILTLKGHAGGITSVSFSPDGRRIVTGSFDTTAKVWDAASGQEILTLKGHTNRRVSSVSFSPDGRRIVTGSWDLTAKVWDATSGREILTLRGHTLPVTSISFSPDGRCIVTGSNDSTARVWDAASGQETLTLKGHLAYVFSVNFSPEGRRIVTSSFDSTAKVWDAQSGREMLTLKGHTNGLSSASFSPDGRRIVTGSRDSTARVWDAQSGREMLTLKGHTLPVHSVSFSPDGRRIVTGSGDNTAKVWSSEGADTPRRQPAQAGAPQGVGPGPGRR